MKKDKILFFIPARGGSKGIPRKNLAILGGKPLISYVIKKGVDACKKISNAEVRLIVSTDDDEIATVAKNSGAEVPFMRPKNLALDYSLDIDVIKHALNYFNSEENYIPDFMVELAATSPLVSEDDIISAINLYKECREPVVSVVKNGKPIHWNYFIDNHRLIPVIKGNMPMRRQDSEGSFRLNGAICIASPEYLLENDSFLCSKTRPFIMPNDRSLDIDLPMDLDIAEIMIKQM